MSRNLTERAEALTLAVAQMEMEHAQLQVALTEVCDYAEQFCDAGDHLSQTRTARELLASMAAK